MRRFAGIIVVCALVHPSALRAQARDSAMFVVRLGLDTVAVEQYTLVGDRIEAVNVSRSPSTVVRRYVAILAPDGRVLRQATGTEDELVEPAAVEGGAIPLAGPFQTPWELALRRAARSDTDSAVISIRSGNDVLEVTLREIDAATFEYENQFGARVVARVDRWGRILHMDAGGGNTVSRVAWFDIQRAAQEFAQRDLAGSGLGPLSPRDTVRARVSGANMLVDYSRPSLRGRDIRLLAPHGEIWRTGANTATHFQTDRTVQIGEATVPAGTYTLFTIPGEEEWTLIINRETGQAGTDYNPERDLVRMPMRLERGRHTERLTIELRSGVGGEALVLRWGTVVASVPLRVAQ